MFCGNRIKNFINSTKNCNRPLILHITSIPCLKNSSNKSFFSLTPVESKFFLPLVFTKMLLSAKGMRKNSIVTSGGNKECRKSQLNQFTCGFEHSSFFLPWLVIYYFHKEGIMPVIKALLVS